MASSGRSSTRAPRAVACSSKGSLTPAVQSIPPEADANKLADIVVESGDILSLVVGHRGSYFCHSTGISLVIAEQAGRHRRGTWPRTWWTPSRRATRTPIPYETLACGPTILSRPWTPSHQPPFPLNSQAASAGEFIQELAAKNLTTIRQRVRRHPEQTWEGAVTAMFPGKTLPAIPKPEFTPAMKVELPCEGSLPNGISVRGT